MSDVLVNESLSIFVVRQGLIREFMTGNVDLYLIKSYHNIDGKKSTLSV